MKYGKGVVLVVAGAVVVAVAVAMLGMMCENGALEARVEALEGVVQGLERRFVVVFRNVEMDTTDLLLKTISWVGDLVKPLLDTVDQVREIDERLQALEEGQWCVDVEQRISHLEYWQEETWLWVERVDDLLTEHTEAEE